MQSTTRETNYLRDTLTELLERARNARNESTHSKNSDLREDAAFHAGKRQGYYETLSVLVQQLDAFGIDRESVGLPADLNLEAELL
jgi:hypothetical protein